MLSDIRPLAFLRSGQRKLKWLPIIPVILHAGLYRLHCLGQEYRALYRYNQHNGDNLLIIQVCHILSHTICRGNNRSTWPKRPGGLLRHKMT